ncbi:MAG: hypothetical protein Q9180_002318 [Flavoplaca navasiana]
MSKKRPRVLPSVDTQLVEIYDDLANENENIRLKAAIAFSETNSPKNCHSPEQLSKVLRRLIRGLCSGRKAARHGFSIALTEFLYQHWGNSTSSDASLQISELIDNLVKLTEATGKANGQEERDHHFGRVFGAGAFIQSGVLLQENVPANAWHRILNIIYEAAKKKPWLRETCGMSIYEAAQMISAGDHNPRFIQALIDELIDSGLAKTPEGIAIWLKVQRHFPKAKMPTGIWQDENPLHRKEKSKLAKILKETPIAGRSDEHSPETLQRGSWTPKINFAWNVILSELMRGKPVEGAVPKPMTIGFRDFWQVAVDEHLFSSISSEERKYWGFRLFQQLFGSASPDFLPDLFSPNFVRCLINQLASKERYLHLAAEKTIKSLLIRAENESSVASAALRGLISCTSHLTVSFDDITKTKTVERLLALAHPSSLGQLVPELCVQLVSPGTIQEKDASARRQITIDQLTYLLKSHQKRTKQDTHGSECSSLTRQILGVLATYSYFSMKNPRPGQADCPVPPMSSRTQETLRTRLSTCLLHILSNSPDPSSLASHVVDVILRCEADKHMNSILDLTGTLGEIISNAREFLGHVRKQTMSESNNKPMLCAFELLYSFTILQLYNGDGDAVGMLDDLRSCFDLLIEHRQTAHHIGSELVVEILLSYVAKPSQLFRRLAQQVFPIFIPIIQHDGLLSMIKVLKTEENLSGQYEMFENDAMHSAEDSSDDGSDVEEVDMTNGNGVQSSPDEEDDSQLSSEGTEDGDQAEEVDEETAAFNAKLAQTLNPGESTDEDMDDEQMEALDGPIASMFKARKKLVSKKQQRMDAKETIVNFKCRVLELLETFVKQRHKDLLALDLVLPLLTVIRTTTSRLVSARACKVLKDFSKRCKGRNAPHIEEQQGPAITELLNEVHLEVMRESSNAHISACNQASLLLAKILVGNDKKTVKAVAEIYAETQSSMSDPQGRIKKLFFVDWLNWAKSVEAKV